MRLPIYLRRLRATVKRELAAGDQSAAIARDAKARLVWALKVLRETPEHGFSALTNYTIDNDVAHRLVEAAAASACREMIDLGLGAQAGLLVRCHQRMLARR